MRANAPKISLVPDAWALPTGEGLLAGRGARVHYRVKGRPALFALWTAVAESLSDGPRTLGELAASVPARFFPEVLRDVVPQLERLGLIEQLDHTDMTSDDEEIALEEDEEDLREHPLWNFFAARSEAPWVHIRRVRDARIGVVASEDLALAIHDGLALHGFSEPAILAVPAGGLFELSRVHVLVEASDFVIVGAESAIARFQIFPAVNEAAVRTAKSWLGGFLDRDAVALGPLFVPGETSCFRCLDLREENHRANLAEHRQFRALLRETPIAIASSAAPFARAHLVQSLLSETVIWTSRLFLPTTFATVIETNTATHETVRHQLFPVPACDACGAEVEERHPSAWDQ
jgi:bacteriocin biosynthesis cyclodehydratase domain-containing protein